MNKVIQCFLNNQTTKGCGCGLCLHVYIPTYLGHVLVFFKPLVCNTNHFCGINSCLLAHHFCGLVVFVYFFSSWSFLACLLVLFVDLISYSFVGPLHGLGSHLFANPLWGLGFCSNVGHRCDLGSQLYTSPFCGLGLAHLLVLFMGLVLHINWSFSCFNSCTFVGLLHDLCLGSFVGLFHGLGVHLSIGPFHDLGLCSFSGPSCGFGLGSFTGPICGLGFAFICWSYLLLWFLLVYWSSWWPWFVFIC